MAASATQLGLTGHGADQATAVANLRRGLLAWCRGLGRQGLLEQGLDRHGVRWDRTGGDIEIFEVVSPSEITIRYEDSTARLQPASQSLSAPQT
jgi:hypothetical protein